MQLSWSTRANADRDEIFDYLASESPSAALRIDAEIERQCDLLTSFPQAGRLGRVLSTRELVISGTPYLVIYRISKQAILIVRLLHGARKWPRAT